MLTQRKSNYNTEWFNFNWGKCIEKICLSVVRVDCDDRIFKAYNYFRVYSPSVGTQMEANQTSGKNKVEEKATPSKNF